MRVIPEGPTGINGEVEQKQYIKAGVILSMLSARFLHPKSIAVFGGREAKKVIEQCEAVGFTGDIWPVHPKHNEISGRKAYRSVA